MNTTEADSSILPIDAGGDEYINRPLQNSIENLRTAIQSGKRKHDFTPAFHVCDLARSVFAAYLVEWTLNGAVNFQEDVVALMNQAHQVFQAALRFAQTEHEAHAHYLEDYLEHNSNRLKVLSVLHAEGREAAEQLLLCPC